MTAMTDTNAPSPVPGIVHLHDRLRARETLYGTFCMIGAPLITEQLGRIGFDWVLIDLEHGGATEADLLPNLLALGATGTVRSKTLKGFPRDQAKSILRGLA